MILHPAESIAQSDTGVAAQRLEMTAGSPAEHRVFHRMSSLRLPVSIRPFGPQLMDSALKAPTDRFREWDRGWVSVWINSQRPYNEGAGPVWRGRGVTLAASAGIAGRVSNLSYALRPIAFWTQNLYYEPSFTASPVGFRDPWIAGIDRPYRFGSASHGRVDPGESYLRFDSRYLGFGLSNVAQVWGPARIHPLVMGNHAGGFPHLFVETARPQSIGIGRVHGRWVAGKLASSGFAETPGRQRLGIGVVGTFLPRGLSGLEIGGSRFFHLYDSENVRDLQSLTLPFSGFLKNRLRNPDGGPDRTANQLASIFARIAPPGANAEIYGEFFREDHSGDWKDLMSEPDHISAYVIGLSRRWRCAAGNYSTLTFEAANGRITHLTRVRGQSSPYTHNDIREGHTLRGMTIGSPAMPGGGALSAKFDRETGNLAWRLVAEIVQTAQNGEGGTFNSAPTGFYNLGVEREYVRNNRRWVATAYVQPGFGDVPGTNLFLAVRIQH